MTTPPAISDQLMTESAEHSKLCDELVVILDKKRWEWIAIRATVGSDKSADRQWESTEDGGREITLRLKIKALASSMSAIKAKMQTDRDVAHNMY